MYPGGMRREVYPGVYTTRTPLGYAQSCCICLPVSPPGYTPCCTLLLVVQCCVYPAGCCAAIPSQALFFSTSLGEVSLALLLASVLFNSDSQDPLLFPSQF